jgi:plasmid stabilization system protein ParE
MVEARQFSSRSTPARLSWSEANWPRMYTLLSAKSPGRASRTARRWPVSKPQCARLLPEALPVGGVALARIRIVCSALALDRVEPNALGLAGDRPTAADRLVRTIVTWVTHLSAYPASGRTVPEFARPMRRQLAHPLHRIIYRNASRVVILTVRPSREELDPAEIRRA